VLPSALGNSAPPFRLAMTIGPGPRRPVDDGDRARLYIPAAISAVKGRPPDLARCRKILVVKLDYIGDWILTIPFLENLRRNAPQAEITVVVLDRVFALAETCCFADRVIAIGRAEGRRIVFGASHRAALAGFAEDYRSGRFDLALVPRWDADFNGALAIAHGSGARAVVGFTERATPRKRLLNQGDDRFYTMAVGDPRAVAHEADRELTLLRALGAEARLNPPSLDLLPADEGAAAQFLGTPENILAVGPFGSEAKKTLPQDILAPVLCDLARRFGLDVVVIAGPDDGGRADAFAKAIGGRSSAGRLGLRATAALLRRARAFIGMDSGPGHMAAAMGIPVAVLVAHSAEGDPCHTGAPERFAPLGAPGQVTIIRPARPTSPCVDGCDAAGAHCILALSPARLRRELAAFLERAVGEGSRSRSRRGRASAMHARA
jgi:ADP-heptose:LPS heptosyltransferase